MLRATPDDRGGTGQGLGEPARRWVTAQPDRPADDVVSRRAVGKVSALALQLLAEGWQVVYGDGAMLSPVAHSHDLPVRDL
jgi:hypothetical protein